MIDSRERMVLGPFSGFTLAESWTAQTVTALAIVASIRVYEQRPRGWLARPSALVVGQSRVPGGGRGVFAAEALASGTVLGTYPVSTPSMSAASHPARLQDTARSARRGVWCCLAHTCES